MYTPYGGGRVQKSYSRPAAGAPVRVGVAWRCLPAKGEECIRLSKAQRRRQVAKDDDWPDFFAAVLFPSYYQQRAILKRALH
ncbi:unnamed protein product, partial [Brenthis ino]